jgi:hypothetical protein
VELARFSFALFAYARAFLDECRYLPVAASLPQRGYNPAVPAIGAVC